MQPKVNFEIEMKNTGENSRSFLLVEPGEEKLSTQLNSFDSKDQSRSEVTKLLLDVRCFSPEFPTIDQLDNHSFQSTTFTDQLFPFMNLQERLHLVLVGDEFYSSNIDHGLNEFYS